VVCVGWLGLTAGCSSRTESGVVRSGLPTETQVNELTLEQATAVCNAEIRAQNEKVAEGDGCQSYAFQQTAIEYIDGLADLDQLRVACGGHYESCLSLLDPEGALPPEECELPELPPADCAATVGELEACLTDQIAFTTRPWPSCDDVSVETLEAGVDRLEGRDRVTTPACATFQATCPSGFLR